MTCSWGTTHLVEHKAGNTVKLNVTVYRGKENATTNPVMYSAVHISYLFSHHSVENSDIFFRFSTT